MTSVGRALGTLQTRSGAFLGDAMTEIDCFLLVISDLPAVDHTVRMLTVLHDQPVAGWGDTY